MDTPPDRARASGPGGRLAAAEAERYSLPMARNPQHLEQLAREFAALSPEDRVDVLSMASGEPAQDIYWSHVERLTVSEAAMDRLDEAFARPPAPTQALRDLMAGKKS